MSVTDDLGLPSLDIEYVKAPPTGDLEFPKAGSVEPKAEPEFEVSVPNGDSKWVTAFTRPKGISDKAFRNIVSAAYTAYIACQGIPSVEDIYKYSDKRYSKAKVSEVTLTEEFINAIQSRGISWRANDYTGISAAQQYAISILTDPTNKNKALQTKLRAAGITYNQYRVWLKQPTFARYLNTLTEGMLSDHIPDFHTIVTQKALNGDLNAIRYANELNGRHDPNKQQHTDLLRVIDLLLEILTRNVTDQATLMRIHQEFNSVIQGTVIKGEIGQ